MTTLTTLNDVIGGYKNDEMIYNFKTMKQGDRTQTPVPV